MMPFATLYVVCSLVSSYRSGEIILRNNYIDNRTCEVVRGEEALARRVDDIKHSAAAVDIDIYKTQQVEYAVEHTTASQIVSTPNIQFK